MVSGPRRFQPPDVPSTAHNPKQCVVMARATFRQYRPTRGMRPLLTAAAALSFYNNPTA